MDLEEVMLLAQDHRKPHRRGIDKAMETLRVQRDAVDEMWRKLQSSRQVRFSAVAPAKCQDRTRWLFDGVVGLHRSVPKTFFLSAIALFELSPYLSIHSSSLHRVQASPNVDDAQQCVLQA
jgi:hypothetical protein